MINDVMNTGVFAVQSGTQNLDASATKLNQAVAATSAQPAKDTSVTVASAAVEQQQALYQVQAGAKVVETADKAIGTLVDAKV
ncbi:hypothetical protein [Salinibius halmophilus]|uniref:hypothetical protein n=1 Tax=Salinibius halmophilus TaxID=1853216 RepID=UPI000E66D9A7|nr:hypothetical protein [Salinibius halmophilus]